jgi:hypothetical protein
MAKPFLIASSSSLGLFCLLLPSILGVYAVIGTMMPRAQGVSDWIIIFIILSVLILLLLFSFKGYLSLWRISADCENKLIIIQRTPLKIYYKQIPFTEIKSIVFLEEKAQAAEVADFWVQSVKITGLQNNILFEEGVSKIINDNLLKELCCDYFEIDYIVEEDEELK